MFDDFRPEVMSREERARMGGSMAAAAIMYALLAAALIAGTTVARKRVAEKLTQVEFATKVPEPPPPPPPPPPVEAVAAQPPQNARPKTKRRELKPPDHVPDEKPKESSEALVAAEPAGPVNGFLTGVVGGTGTAHTGSLAPPPPKLEPPTPPVFSPRNLIPKYTALARRKEVEGVVVVGFDVLENGSVTNITIVSGPGEFRESVLKTVAAWRFQPATRAGKPVRMHLTKSIRFRLSDE